MISKEPELSFLTFVAYEQEQAERHELIGGQVVPFLGGSIDHETITVNVIAKLHAAVEPPCKVFGSAAIVQTVSRIGEDGYRPDVTVSCSSANIRAASYVAEPKIRRGGSLALECRTEMERETVRILEYARINSSSLPTLWNALSPHT